MKKRGLFLSCFLVLGAIFVLSCSDKKAEESQNDIAAPSSENVKSYLENIRTKIFALSEVSSDDWELILVGDHETVLGDICGSLKEGQECQYTTEHFEKLVPGEVYYDLLDEGTQKKIDALKKYFAGDIIVENIYKEKYSVNRNKDLGKHELGLVKKEFLTPLRDAGYGNTYWPDLESEDRIEAFQHL